MSTRAFDADVAIVGYGPTGVSAANFLGARGVRAIALERAKDIYQRARAVTVNDWTLRCFQSVGLDVALKAGMDETYALRWITFDGTVLREVGFPPALLGHAQSYAIYQPTMEQTLRDGAARFADHVEVRYGVSVTDVAQDADGVTLEAIEVDSGQSCSVRARYVLACDGGSSRMRERLGIELLGDTVDTRWVVIDAKVKRWWPNRHILTQWSDRRRPVVDIALANGNHRWELPLEPHESEDDFQTHEQLWRLLGTMGVTHEQVEIHQHAFYKHHIRTADRWRDGRVFLVGDAAHLMPPWAGQGMQSGVRDADNLSWKLAEVLAGRLPDTVLESYQQERAPDVARCTGLSIALGRISKREMTEAEEQAGRPIPGAPRQSAIVSAPFLHAGWLTGRIGLKSAIGKMIPQPRVAGSNGQFAMLDALIGNGFVLLGDGIDPASLLTRHERAQWDALDAQYHAVLTPDQFGGDDRDIIDIEGSLTGWMRQHGARVIAVRPDRFVAASDASGLAVPGAALPVRAELAPA
jgi:3-(3-hydroxy-phenyl)propionate hydroxylase